MLRLKRVGQITEECETLKDNGRVFRQACKVKYAFVATTGSTERSNLFGHNRQVKGDAAEPVRPLSLPPASLNLARVWHSTNISNGKQVPEYCLPPAIFDRLRHHRKNRDAITGLNEPGEVPRAEEAIHLCRDFDRCLAGTPDRMYKRYNLAFVYNLA